jgi:hypothetical protein
MTFPFASTATPRGLLNDAAEPVPSANCADPLPASVLTPPPGVTRRTQWFSESATKINPLAATATLAG